MSKNISTIDEGWTTPAKGKSYEIGYPEDCEYCIYTNFKYAWEHSL